MTSLTHPPDPTDPVVDAYGTAVGRGDMVVPIGDPLGPAWLVEQVRAGGELLLRHGTDAVPSRATRVRVVTIRDGAGVRIGPGDLVRSTLYGADSPTYVVRGVLHSAHVVTVDVGGEAPIVVIPALLARVDAAIGEGDQVVDVAGTRLVVLAVYNRVADVEALYDGARSTVPVCGLRRVHDGAPGPVIAAGVFSGPPAGDDEQALLDVQRLLAAAPHVAPYQRPAG